MPDVLRMTETVVRPASHSDHDAFLPLYLGLLEFDRMYHPQHSEFDAIVAARADQAVIQLEATETRTTLVAELNNGALAGYIITKIENPGPASTEGTMPKGKIDELYYELFPIAADTRHEERYTL